MAIKLHVLCSWWELSLSFYTAHNAKYLPTLVSYGKKNRMYSNYYWSIAVQCSNLSKLSTCNALNTFGVPSFGPSSNVRYRYVGCESFLDRIFSKLKLQSTESGQSHWSLAENN